MPIVRYDESKLKLWDSFIYESSVNGNFLQSHAFLDYHPKERFEDYSLMYYDPKGNLRALIPGAVRYEEGQKLFVSHPGSTYGGIVLDKKSCGVDRFQAIVTDLEEYLKEEGFAGAVLKFPPDFLWTCNEAPLVEYLLIHNGYNESIELTTYVEISAMEKPTVSYLSQGKRTNINNCLKKNLEVRPLASEAEVEQFYHMLEANLQKHGVRPVHSIPELLDLHDHRLAGKTEFYGVFNEGEMIASGWVFFFDNQNYAHTQYLCASDEYSKLSPMSFLYYSVIELCREKGIKNLSWGVSTEDHGKVLNVGLTESKENFGSTHGVHRTYEKMFSEVAAQQGSC